jgi:inner membrane protein
LMISANLPDLDVLVYLTDTPWIEFRRGWTHGVLAQAALPVVWTTAVWLFDRYKRAGGAEGERPFHLGWTLVLALVGVYTHVFLDFLNNYGVRVATPVSWQWFYGDAIFIIDPWMWAMLATGVWMAGRGRPRPARIALVTLSCYIAVMLTSGWAARRIVAETWQASHGAAPRALMVGPVPLWPFSRQVIVDAGDHYETGVFSWVGAVVRLSPEQIPKQDEGAHVAAARQANNVRAFLVWSRFPYWTTEPVASGTRVTVSDMRFAGRNGFSEWVVVRR